VSVAIITKERLERLPASLSNRLSLRHALRENIAATDTRRTNGSQWLEP
jgi:hypothetical protein